MITLKLRMSTAVLLLCAQALFGNLKGKSFVSASSESAIPGHESHVLSKSPEHKLDFENGLNRQVPRPMSHKPHVLAAYEEIKRPEKFSLLLWALSKEYYLRLKDKSLKYTDPDYSQHLANFLSTILENYGSNNGLSRKRRWSSHNERLSRLERERLIRLEREMRFHPLVPRWPWLSDFIRRWQKVAPSDEVLKTNNKDNDENNERKQRFQQHLNLGPRLLKVGK